MKVSGYMTVCEFPTFSSEVIRRLMGGTSGRMTGSVKALQFRRWRLEVREVWRLEGYQVKISPGCGGGIWEQFATVAYSERAITAEERQLD